MLVMLSCHCQGGTLKIIRIYIYSVAVLLALTALAKMISSFGHGTVLQAQDPLIGLKFRDLFRVVCAFEAGVACICCFSSRIWLQAGSVAWLATSILTYRLGLAWIGYRKPCN